MKSPFLPVLMLSLLTLTACGKDSPYSPEVEALVKQTLKNMVFVKGDSFVMDDVGYEVPEDEPGGE